MKPVLRFALIAAISLTAASIVNAQESWVGKTILVKKLGIKIKKNDEAGKSVVVGELTGIDYKVFGDRNGRLEINDNHGNTGWFAKADAVLLEDAVAFFTEGIRQNGKEAHAYNCRATAWRLKGELDMAIKDFGEVLRLDPSAYAYNNRGIAWKAKKDYAKAISDYNEAIRLDPKSVLAHYNRGNAWSKKKESEKAIADYNEAIRLDPKYAQTYNSRAWLWATCSNAKYRDGKKAIDSAMQALEFNPKSANNMDTLAAAYAESGDFAEAVRWQEKALADPQLKNDPEARRRLELYRDKKPYRQE